MYVCVICVNEGTQNNIVQSFTILNSLLSQQRGFLSYWKIQWVGHPLSYFLPWMTSFLWYIQRRVYVGCCTQHEAAQPFSFAVQCLLPWWGGTMALQITNTKKRKRKWTAILFSQYILKVNKLKGKITGYEWRFF